VTRVVDKLENAAEAVTHRLGLDPDAGHSEDQGDRGTDIKSRGAAPQGSHGEGVGHRVAAGLAGLAGQVQHKVEEVTGSVATHMGTAELPIETPDVLRDKSAQASAAAPAGPADEAHGSGVQHSGGSKGVGFFSALLRTISGTKPTGQTA
jgi:hypothetical protein